MAIAQGQIRQGIELEEPSSVRRPHFPKSLYDKPDKFINPEAEAQRILVVPEQTISSPMISLELARATTPRGARRSETVFSTIYEYLLAVIGHMKKRFGKSRRASARLTRMGDEALSQLRYLSLLCDAMSERTPEEVLLAESAFGEAYYEIMTLSANLEKMTEKEGEHHLRNYARQMSKILNAAD